MLALGSVQVCLLAFAFFIAKALVRAFLEEQNKVESEGQNK